MCQVHLGGLQLWAGMQAMDQLMPGFDREIARNAQRVLINPRSIDWHTGVLATKVTPGTSSYKQHCLPLQLFTSLLGLLGPKPDSKVNE